MYDSEWPDVWDKLKALWPRMIESASEEQQKSYYRVLSAFEKHIVIEAMREWADTDTRYPKPPQLREKCQTVRKRKQPPRDTRGETHAETDERERIEQQHAFMRQTVDELTADEIAGHVRMILAANPYMRWLAKYSPQGNTLGSTMLRSEICDRLADGLSSTDRTARQHYWKRYMSQNEEQRAHYESALDYKHVYITDDMLDAADQALQSPPRASIGQGESQRNEQGKRKDEATV